jgi:hypothetical protein
VQVRVRNGTNKATGQVAKAAPTITAQIPTESKVGETIAFSARADPAGVRALGFHWDFGDGTIAEGSAIPVTIYWAEDTLDVISGGSTNNCAVTQSLTSVCGSSSSMLVCSGFQNPESNTCNIIGCGLNTNTPQKFFRRLPWPCWSTHGRHAVLPQLVAECLILWRKEWGMSHGVPPKTET